MKPPLVLLPGMMCDERLFTPQLDYFCEKFDVHVSPLNEADNIGGMARNVLSDMPRRTFDVAGLSMGGIVAMELMAQCPERIDRVILMDTNHLADTNERKAVRKRQITDVQAGHLRDVIVEEMKPNYLAAQNRDNSQLLNLLVDMAIDQGRQAFVNQSNALMSRRDYSETLQSWRKPVLLICGAEDTLCTPDRHQEMADALDNARLELIPGAGHISTLEQPSAVNMKIDRFLTRPTTEATT